MRSCRINCLVNQDFLITTRSVFSGIVAGLRLSPAHSCIGTSGTNILSEGGTLKKVVSL
jgi:hypothetical protein